MLADFIERNKRLLIILTFFLATLLLGYLMYRVFYKPLLEPSISKPVTEEPGGPGFPSPGEGPGQIVEEPGEVEPLPTEPTQPEETVTQASPVANGGLTQVKTLTETPTLGLALSSELGKLQYYDKTEGKFYKIDENGEAVLMSDKVFHNVDAVTWSPKKSSAILEYPDGSNIVYNFDTEQQVTLPKHWEDFSYSPDGNDIVMKSLGNDPNNRWLAITNENGSRVRIIEDIGLNDEKVYPNWSNSNQVVAMHTEGIDFNRQEVYFMGLNNENFKSTVIEGRGFQPKWSEKGDKLLYSVYSSENGMRPGIWIVNAYGNRIGSNKKNLLINTWAEKCTFSNNSEIYCAVPEYLEEGAGLFPEMAKATKDNLYKINTQTGIKKLIAVPDDAYNMSNITISGDNLYFTDNNSEKIHQIKLP